MPQHRDLGFQLCLRAETVEMKIEEFVPPVSDATAQDGSVATLVGNLTSISALRTATA